MVVPGKAMFNYFHYMQSRLESIAGDKVVVDLVTPEKLDTYASPSATAKFTERFVQCV